ncbi:transposase [Streptomyces hirsutus]
MKVLFEVVAGALAQPRTPGVRFGPYRTVSFDGCSSIKTPDSERNRGWLGRCPHGGYPQIELMTLVETGTRAVIGAVFGPTREGETSYATRLLHHLSPEMLVLWDRGFDGNDFLAAVHATGARVVGRISQRRWPPVLQPLADSSYLSVIGGVVVRIIEAQVRVACTDGSGLRRLLPAGDHPAGRPAATPRPSRLVRRPTKRWERESIYVRSCDHTVLQGRVRVACDAGRVGRARRWWSRASLYKLVRAVGQLVDGGGPGRAYSCPAAADRPLHGTVTLLACNPESARRRIGTIGRKILSALSPDASAPPGQYQEGEVAHLALCGWRRCRRGSRTVASVALPPQHSARAADRQPVRGAGTLTRVLGVLRAGPSGSGGPEIASPATSPSHHLSTTCCGPKEGCHRRIRTGRYARGLPRSRELRLSAPAGRGSRRLSGRDR